MSVLRRRWFRFSLRTLFAVVTLLAIPIGWLTNQVMWLQRRNAAFSEMVGDRRLLRETDYFHGAYRCATPAGLDLIYGEYLGFSDLWIHPDRYQSDYDRIQRLFPEATIHLGETDEQLRDRLFHEQVVRIKESDADRICVDRGPRTDDLLKSIVGLKGLRRLHLTPCNVTVEGVKQLSSFPDLVWVEFFELPVTDAWIDELQSCPQLESLKMVRPLQISINKTEGFMLGQQGAPVTVSAVLRLPHLKELTIDCPGVLGLKQLEAAGSLERLTLVGRPDHADIDALREKLPNCQIIVIPNWK